MLSTYVPLLRDRANRRFLIGSAVGRLGYAMYGLALVTMVALRTKSFAVAGAVSATGLVVLAVSAVVTGRLIDRYGQRVVALPLLAWSLAWTLVVVACSAWDGPRWTLFVGYALASVPANIGTMSRARWTHRLASSPARLHSAMSLEQVVDELSFVLGPALAVALATAWFPEAGLLAAAVLAAVGTLLFLSDRPTEPPVDTAAHHSTALAVRKPGIVLLAVVLFMVGTIFGSNEVTTVAVSKHLGHESAAGVVIGLFAVGSATAGLWFGTRTLRRHPARVLAYGTAGMFLLELPVLAATGHVVALAAALLVAGAATAPTLIIAMQLAGRLVSVAQVSEAMSVVLTGLLIGVATGSAVAGAVIERFHPAAGFVVPVTAGVIALACSVTGRRLLSRDSG